MAHLLKKQKIFYLSLAHIRRSARAVLSGVVVRELVKDELHELLLGSVPLEIPSGFRQDFEPRVLCFFVSL